ncbi:cytochrome P450 [Microbacterium sp. No. 7]|uniref:cytochrome P450 n=1 Tax=Microbacterium sp. No. 7 TaxID=1714373 RepID=UPI0006CF26C7|nr:cytochrome P450 [Microbacterium sp. No. 7]ALJ18889.1 hypothetical protein AOA12_02775 [Microbacterium sp. No. 7]
MTTTWDRMPTERPSKLDPPEIYAEIRESDPMARVRFPNGMEGYLVTRFDDVVAGFGNPNFVAQGRPRYEVADANPDTKTPFAGTFVNMDGEEHHKYRRLLTARFSVRYIRQNLQEFIDRTVDEHLDRIAAGPDEFDFVADMALSVPSLVICEILDVPVEDRAAFNTVSANMMDMDRAQALREQDQKWIFDYIRTLLERKRSEGATKGLLAELLQQQKEADFEITDEDLVRIGGLLLVAGHDTTTMMISLSMLTLLTMPEARAAFASGEPVGTAVEELLRFLTIVHFGLARRAATDFEFLGTPLEKDDLVVFSLVGANRDPRMYENPDALDFDRQALRHVAFGFGVHQCLGQNVARAEITSVLTKTLQRFPDLRLAVPVDEVPMHDRSTNYGVEKLWVAKS